MARIEGVCSSCETQVKVLGIVETSKESFLLCFNCLIKQLNSVETCHRFLYRDKERELEKLKAEAQDLEDDISSSYRGWNKLIDSIEEELTPVTKANTEFLQSLKVDDVLAHYTHVQNFYISYEINNLTFYKVTKVRAWGIEVVVMAHSYDESFEGTKRELCPNSSRELLSEVYEKLDS